MSEYNDKEQHQQIRDHVQKILEAAKINAKVYDAEMLRHEFLDHTYRIQRTTFSNGWQITVDFDKDTYSIEKVHIS